MRGKEKDSVAVMCGILLMIYSCGGEVRGFAINSKGRIKTIRGDEMLINLLREVAFNCETA